MLPGRLLRHTDTISVFSDDGIEEVDIYGNVTYEEFPPVDVHGCVVVPATMDEHHEPGRNWAVAGYDVYVPAASAHLITEFSRIRWDGRVWDVEGEVRKWKNPYTGTSFGLFRVERAGTDGA